jgi:hypothetical protein
MNPMGMRKRHAGLKRGVAAEVLQREADDEAGADD